MDHGFPVVRVELEGMKLGIVHAISEIAAQRDEQIKAALDEALKPENVQAVINREVARMLNAVIHEEVETFYRYGAGRERVRKVLHEILAVAEEQGK